MSSPTQPIRLDKDTVVTAASGMVLGGQIAEAIEGGEPVRLDLNGVERMTPSVANAIVMTVLEAVGEAMFRSHLSVEIGSEPVRDAWEKAVDRYRRGIRLTTQRPPSS